MQSLKQETARLYYRDVWNDLNQSVTVDHIRFLYFLLLFPPITWLVINFIRELKERRYLYRVEHDLCSRCGYDIRGAKEICEL